MDYLPAAHHYARRQLRERLRDLRAVELEHRVRLLTAAEYASIRKSVLQAIAELRTVRGVEYKKSPGPF
jgi:predicted metallo-beta-lactamase superfamily hydrolase